MAYQSISFRPSTNILSVQWDPETKTLRVQFIRDGRTYIYEGVDAQTAEGFSRAPSAGIYLNQFIKNVYPYSEE
jgi:KTSC domain